MCSSKNRKVSISFIENLTYGVCVSFLDFLKLVNIRVPEALYQETLSVDFYILMANLFNIHLKLRNKVLLQWATKNENQAPHLPDRILPILILDAYPPCPDV